MDCGLSGNFLELDYEKYGFLAQHSWWSHLWRLLSMYGVTLQLFSECYYPLPRKHDVGLMNILVERGVFAPAELIRINRVRHFKGILVLSELTHCDGITLRKEYLSESEDRIQSFEEHHRYPIERPTASDFGLWRTALFTVFSTTSTLYCPLGKYLRHPPLPHEWLCSSSNHILFRRSSAPSSSVAIYVKSPSASVSRRNAVQFTFSCTAVDPPVATHYASVTSLTDSSVTVHSFAPVPSPPTVLSLQEVIDSFEDHTMWDRFSFEDDGSWLLRALLNGTLIIVHDGSYMPQLTSQACSCAFVLYCSSTDKWAIGSFAEESENADNYRGEWLGSIGTLQVLLAVISTTSVSLDAIPPVHAHCDNMGVINHNQNLTRSLPEKQAQADLIRLCREYRRRLCFSIEYHHVKGHLDKVLRWDQLTRVQRENCIVDSVARTALLDAFLDDTYISSIFPHEQVVVKVDGKRVTGSPSMAIGRAWGYKVARELFHSRKIVDRKHFRLIYWDGVESCMKTFPAMFRVWVTKHVSHFCGTNRQLSRIDPTVLNTCPSCGCNNEDTSHVVRCPSPGRTAFYNDSVSDLIEWLKEADTDPQLVYMIEEFLSGRGDVKVASLFAHDLPIYGFLASLMDEVGFDSFVEGRILTVLVEFQFAHYQEIPTRWTVERWAKGLIQRLLGLTHRQWLYRNAVVHFKGPDGYTHAEHERILSKMQDFLWVDPQDLRRWKWPSLQQNMPVDKMILPLTVVV